MFLLCFLCGLGFLCGLWPNLTRMSPALLSLLALLTAIVVSFASRLNVGIAAIPLAWAVGAYAGQPVDAVLGGFPGSLFVTLAGVTLLFALAEDNGTIGNLATRLAALASGRSWLLPVIVFFIACAISSAGPGAIPATALVAPLAFAMANRRRSRRSSRR